MKLRINFLYNFEDEPYECADPETLEILSYYR